VFEGLYFALYSDRMYLNQKMYLKKADVVKKIISRYLSAPFPEWFHEYMLSRKR